MTNCMDRYKNEFSIRFAQIMQKELSIWKQIQKNEQKSLYNLASIGGYLFAGLLGFIPGKNEHEYHFKMHCWIAVFFFIGAIILNIQMTNKTYQNKIKSTLFPELLKVFGDKIYYNLDVGAVAEAVTGSIINQKDAANILDEFSQNYNASGNNIPDYVFENCKLYNHKITQREDDDIFNGEYQNVKFLINETDFGWNSNDKHHTYHSMFKGIGMRFKMNKEIKNRVLILTKHSFTKIPPNFEKVTLEYEKFNKKYEVWAETHPISGSGQVEARYLLNTAFMERLMQIQTSFKVNKMCCSVFDDEMLIMLSTKKDLFEMNHLFGKIDDIKQYRHLFDEFASVLSFIEVLNLSSKTKL